MRSKLLFFLLFVTILLIPHSNPRSESFTSYSNSNSFYITPPDSGNYLLTQVTTPVEVYSLFYDDAGKIIKKIISQAFPSGVTYTYDNAGNLLTEYSEEWDNQKKRWDFLSRISFTYDKNGNKISELREYTFVSRTFAVRMPAEGFIDPQGKKLGKTNNNIKIYQAVKLDFTYDGQGRILTQTSKRWGEDSFFAPPEKYYTYDKKGNKILVGKKYFDENEWENDSRIIFVYDRNGKVLSELTESWTDSTWANSFRTTYTYDNNGYKLSELSEHWMDNIWNNLNRITYINDSNGNTLIKLVETWDDRRWTIFEKISSSYNNKGNKLADKLQKWEENRIQNIATITYNNDNDGNVVSGNVNPRADYYLNHFSLQFPYNFKKDVFKFIYTDSFTAKYKFIPAKKKQTP